MNKQEKKLYKNKPAIGVKCTSNFGGIAIKEFIYGIEDYVIFEGELGDVHKIKIQYNMSDEPYFMYHGKREKLDDYMGV
jgi:hypothetical protein